MDFIAIRILMNGKRTKKRVHNDTHSCTILFYRR